MTIKLPMVPVIRTNLSILLLKLMVKFCGFIKMKQKLGIILLSVFVTHLSASENRTSTAADSNNFTTTATTVTSYVATTTATVILNTSVGEATTVDSEAATATWNATTASVQIDSTPAATTDTITIPAETTNASLIWVEKSLRGSSRSYLVSMDINVSYRLSRQLLFQGERSSQFWAIAMDYHRNLIYYTDYRENYFGVYNTQSKTHRVLFRGLSFGIDGLAVDWFTGNIYWTDTDLHRIMVADPTLAHYLPIVKIDSLVPAKIAIDPLQRSLFWSERTQTYCAIYRSDLTGNNRVLLHNLTDTKSIDEMIIDATENRLYWSDRVINSRASTGRVRSFALGSPTNISTHISLNSGWFLGLASFQNKLYVTNQQQGQLLVYTKTSGIVSLLLRYSGAIPRAMIVFHPSLQPLSGAQQQAHPCRDNDCEQLCLTDDWDSYICACTLGYQLQSDNVSCGVNLLEDNYTLLLDEKRQTIYQVSLDNPEEVSALPIKDVGTVHSVDYDYKDGKIYWCDTSARRIFRSFLNGEDREIFIDDVRAFSIGIDHITRNLYIADAASDTILVASLNLPNITATLHVNDIHTVWKLIVSHSFGKVFWADWGQVGPNNERNTGRIESINLDGSGRTVVANNLSVPHGITLDEQTSTLFWTEITDASIGWYNLDTGRNGKFSLRFDAAFVNFVLGISHHKGFLYVTDLKLPSVYRVLSSDVTANFSVDGTPVQPFGPSIFYSLSGIRIVDSIEVIHTGISTCSNLTEACPQICLPTDTNHTCACAHHSDYIAANNTCTQVRKSDDITAPSFGNTCPASALLFVDKCSTSRVFNFTLPKPTDENTVAAFKSAQTGSPPYTISTGTRTFSYRAFDPSGNVGVCTFSVLVVGIPPCSNRPTLPEGAQVRSTSCGSQYGSVVDVSCPGSDDIRFQYECEAFRGWKVIGDADCSSIPTTSTASTTVRVTNASAVLTPRGGNRTNGPGGLSGGAIAAIVITIILVVAVGLFLVRKYASNTWLSMKVLWDRRDDTITLTNGRDGYNAF